MFISMFELGVAASRIGLDLKADTAKLWQSYRSVFSTFLLHSGKDTNNFSVDGGAGKHAILIFQNLSEPNATHRYLTPPTILGLSL